MKPPKHFCRNLICPQCYHETPAEVWYEPGDESVGIWGGWVGVVDRCVFCDVPYENLHDVEMSNLDQQAQNMMDRDFEVQTEMDRAYYGDKEL